MSNVIIVAEISEKNGWANIKTNDGKEVSIMLSKCPKLAEQVKTAKAGSELTGKLVEKDGKNYLWDTDDKKSGFSGGKSFAPKDKKFDAGIESLKAAASMFALDKEKNADQVILIAEKFHAFLMSKVTAAPVEPAK